MTAFGSHAFGHGVHEWRIKLIAFECGGYSAPPYVGVINDDESYLKAYINSKSWKKCGYQFCGGNGRLYGVNHKFNAIGYEWDEPNDVLRIILDLDAKIMKISVNDGEPVVVFGNIVWGRYRLAVSSVESKYARFALV